MQNETLLPIPDVLKRVPVSRSKWFEGVKSGVFPKPVRLGRSTFWKSSDIDRLIQTLSNTTA